MKNNLKIIKGNVLRYTIDKSEIAKFFKKSKKYLTNDQKCIEDTLAEDYALYKRKKSHGPRTQWHFDWSNLQNYIWVPILYITNKLIYLINIVLLF